MEVSNKLYQLNKYNEVVKYGDERSVVPIETFLEMPEVKKVLISKIACPQDSEFSIDYDGYVFVKKRRGKDGTNTE